MANNLNSENEGVAPSDLTGVKSVVEEMTQYENQLNIKLKDLQNISKGYADHLIDEDYAFKLGSCYGLYFTMKLVYASAIRLCKQLEQKYASEELFNSLDIILIPLEDSLKIVRAMETRINLEISKGTESKITIDLEVDDVCYYKNVDGYCETCHVSKHCVK